LRIAIPTFDMRISPRFDHAPGCTLVDIEGDKIISTSYMTCEGWRDIDRVSRLIEAKVDVLICGALPHFLLSVLLDNNIRVIPWVAGEIQEALSLFIQGRLKQGMALCAGKGRRCNKRLTMRGNSLNKRE